ncbi:MAG: hypothetical protein AVDCRST_MAG88-1587, partial [uncultured Thermomicrobiales bacterium]
RVRAREAAGLRRRSPAASRAL